MKDLKHAVRNSVGQFVHWVPTYEMNSKIDLIELNNYRNEETRWEIFSCCVVAYKRMMEKVPEIILFKYSTANLWKIILWNLDSWRMRCKKSIFVRIWKNIKYVKII